MEAPPILHVVVVGFHHIKGYQVEYAYPPLIEGGNVDSQDLPEPWKHLPSLALPDGAHNYEEDTIYFHLPALDNPRLTVYGISCYRQINAETLLHRGSDITRSSVQKSVCVLSTLPLYGLIQAKLELVTHAYFDERDFSKVTLLEDTYRNLNSSLSKDLLQGTQVFLGLSCRDLILHFRHKAVLLFKLLLLERKVLFYKTPVKELCSSVLTLCSLFPGMIESGLKESAATVGMKQFQPEFLQQSHEHDYVEVCFSSDSAPQPEQSELKQSLDAVTTEKSNKTPSNGHAATESSHIPKNKNCSNDGFQDLSLLSKTIRSSESKSLARRESSEASDTRMSGSNSQDGLGNQASQTQNSSRKHSQEGDKTASNNAEQQRLSIGSMGKEIICKILPSSLVDIKATKSPSIADDSVFEEEDKLLTEIEELLDTEPKEKNEMRSKLEFVERDDSDAKTSSTQSSCKGTPTGDATGKGSIWSKLPTAIYSLATKEPGKQDTLQKENSDLEENGTVILSIQDAIKDQDELLLQSIPKVLALSLESCGLPLPIFSKGSLCLPYVSLPIIDVLSDITVRSCVVGATNDLFKQKKHLFDVIVEVDDGKVNILDNDLKKQLHLTMEDLRFADYLVKNVLEDSKDLFLDGTGWQGGEEWLRAQFKIYLISLMRTAQLDETSKEYEAFNASFINTWKTTHNFKMWNSVDHTCLNDIPAGHFYKGQLSVADMKLRLAHTIQNSERGRKINQAVVSTGRVVAQTTGKVVGGALTSAKSVVSSLWSHFSPPPSVTSQEGVSPSKECSVECIADEGEQQQSPDEESK